MILLKKKDNTWMYDWHDWFAWHPVRLDDTRDVVWLETIQRRRHSISMLEAMAGIFISWDYVKKV